MIKKSFEIDFSNTINVCGHRVRFWYQYPVDFVITDELKQKITTDAELKIKESIFNGLINGDLKYDEGDDHFHGSWAIRDIDKKVSSVK